MNMPLDVDRVFEALREDVVVIGCRGAARHHQLGAGEPDGEAEGLGI